jgi:hypothetical protein
MQIICGGLAICMVVYLAGIPSIIVDEESSASTLGFPFYTKYTKSKSLGKGTWDENILPT